VQADIVILCKVPECNIGLVLWNWVSVPDGFAELARDFSCLKGVLFASHVTASSPSYRCKQGEVCAWKIACSQEVEGG